MSKYCTVCKIKLLAKDSFYYEKQVLCINCLSEKLIKKINEKQANIDKNQYDIEKNQKSFEFNDSEKVKISDRIKNLILTSIEAKKSSERKKARSRLSEYSIKLITANEWASKLSFNISLILIPLRIVFAELAFGVISNSLINFEALLDVIIKIILVPFFYSYLLIWIILRIIAVFGSFPRLKFIKSKEISNTNLIKRNIDEYIKTYSQMSENDLEKLLENPEDLVPEVIDLIRKELSIRKSNMQ